jgi:malonyl-CoA O-methyltransferase
VNIGKEKLARQFNRAVETYDEYSIVQKKMAYRILFTLKARVPHLDHILEVGCRTGYLTQLLLDHYPKVTVTAVDLAENMIEQAMETVEPSSRVRFIVGDAEEIAWEKQGSYDLIVSNATLQWLKTPAKTIQNLVKAIKPCGWMITTTYGPDTFQELRSIFQRVELEMGMEPEQHNLSLHTADYWTELFQEAGLVQINTQEYWNRLEFKDCRQFLESVKAIGDSYSEAKQNFNTTRRILMGMMHRYNIAYRTKEGVYATYQLIQIM